MNSSKRCAAIWNNTLVLVFGIMLGVVCAQDHDSRATGDIPATQDGCDQPSAAVLPVLRVRKDSDQKITVAFVNSGDMPISDHFAGENYPVFLLYFSLFQDGERLDGETYRYAPRTADDLRTLKPGDFLNHVVSLPTLGLREPGRYLLTASYFRSSAEKRHGVTPMRLEQPVAIIEVIED